VIFGLSQVKKKGGKGRKRPKKSLIWVQEPSFEGTRNFKILSPFTRALNRNSVFSKNRKNRSFLAPKKPTSVTEKILGFFGFFWSVVSGHGGHRISGHRVDSQPGPRTPSLAALRCRPARAGPEALRPGGAHTAFLAAEPKAPTPFWQGKTRTFLAVKLTPFWQQNSFLSFLAAKRLFSVQCRPWFFLSFDLGL
jgi:hypothetical protein